MYFSLFRLSAHKEILLIKQQLDLNCAYPQNSYYSLGEELGDCTEKRDLNRKLSFLYFQVAGTGHTSQSRAQRQLAKTPSQSSRPHTRLRIPCAIIKPPGRCSSKVNTVHRGCADLRGFDPRGVIRTSALFGFIQHHLS